MASSAKVRKQAKRLKGRKVCITLHDGRSYVGWITGLEKEALILSHPPAPRKPQRSRKPGRPSSRQHSPQHSRQQKAEVSAFMPLLGSLLGGGGGGAALGGLAGGGGGGGGGFGGLLGGGLRLFGIVQKAMPVMKMGYGMIKQIKPFMEGLKGLMGR